MGKGVDRERMPPARTLDGLVAAALCNMVGGQDGSVCDGGSVIFDERGDLVARARQSEEDLMVVKVNRRGIFRRRLHDPRRREEDSDHLKDIDQLMLPEIVGCR